MSINCWGFVMTIQTINLTIRGGVFMLKVFNIVMAINTREICVVFNEETTGSQQDARTTPPRLVCQKDPNKMHKQKGGPIEAAVLEREVGFFTGVKATMDQTRAPGRLLWLSLKRW